MSKNLFVLSLVVFSSFGSAIGKEPVPYGVFQELPKGEITPQGWMAEVLRRQRDGLALNRKASGYPYDTDLWVGKLPKGQWKDYEQTAYFLDGAYRCGLLLEDKALTDLALSNIDYVLEHPKPNGKLGPTDKDFNRKLKPDEADGPTSTGEQWPFAVFTRLLMAHYSATGDQRVIEGLTQHYLALPETSGSLRETASTSRVSVGCMSKLGTSACLRSPSVPGPTFLTAKLRILANSIISK